MNLSTPSHQHGLNEKSPERDTGSPESSGSKAIEDPILKIDSRADALDVLTVRNDLSNAQRKYLNRVVLNEHRVVRVGKPKQDSSDYWARKYKEKNFNQLCREVTKVNRQARILAYQLKTTFKGSKFANALKMEQALFIKRVNALNEELIKRKAA